MISYNYRYPLTAVNEKELSNWIRMVIDCEEHELGELSFTFVDDGALHEMNVEYLGHNSLTDVISFDYTVGKVVQGDVFISVDRVKDNAREFGVNFNNELSRVMIHGVLHYCGYKDKTDSDKLVMRGKEDFYLNMLFK